MSVLVSFPVDLLFFSMYVVLHFHYRPGKFRIFKSFSDYEDRENNLDSPCTIKVRKDKPLIAQEKNVTKGTCLFTYLLFILKKLFTEGRKKCISRSPLSN